MTARSSTGNFSHFGAYFAHKLRSLRSMIVLNSIFALLSYPAVMAILLPYAHIETTLDDLRRLNLDNTFSYESYSQISRTLESLLIAAIIIGAAMLVAMFIMSYVMIGNSFRWLYKKSIVDMDYSLPVSDDTRFFGDLLASMTGTLVPHILAIAIGAGLYWCLPFKGLDAPADEVSAVFSVLLQLTSTGLFSCVMFAAISLLVISLCGRAVEARIMPFVINAAIPVIHAMCVLILISNLYGYDYGGNFEYMGIASTSPIGLIIMTFIGLINTYDIIEYNAPLFTPQTFIPLLIITIGCFVAAYLLIRFRRTERVGNPYVYPGVKLAIPAIVTFTIVSPFMAAIFDDGSFYFSDLSGMLVFMVITTFIVYIIMELISGKGFKKFHVTLLKYGCTLVGCILLSVILYFSQGLGYARYTPRIEDVSEVYINLDGGNVFADSRWSVDIDDEETIQAIIDFHKNLPKHEETKPNAYSGDTLTISYNLKNGTYLRRYYYLTHEQYIDAVKSLVTPEVYYTEHFHENFGYMLDYMDSSDYRITNVTFRGGNKTVSIPLEELAKAFRADCENLTYALLCTDTDIEKTRLGLTIVETYTDYYGNKVTGEYIQSFEVLSWYENTIKLLDKHAVRNIFRDSTDKCSTAFALKIPYDTTYYGEVGNINAETLMLAALADKLPPAVLENYGYFIDEWDKYNYEYYYDSYSDSYVYVESSSEEVTTSSARYNIIDPEWELVMLEASDPRVQKLKELSCDVMPVEYSKPYNEPEYVIVTVFTDATEELVLLNNMISYDHEIIKYVTAENYSEAEKIFDYLT